MDSQSTKNKNPNFFWTPIPQPNIHIKALTTRPNREKKLQIKITLQPKPQQYIQSQKYEIQINDFLVMYL